MCLCGVDEAVGAKLDFCWFTIGEVPSLLSKCVTACVECVAASVIACALVADDEEEDDSAKRLSLFSSKIDVL